MKKLIFSIKIILFCVLISIIYGILHDLVTVNISIEYFTIGHPVLIESKNPLHLAIFWGVIATWWVGLLLGIIISFSALVGRNPVLKYKTIILLIIKLTAIMSIFAIVGGILGYLTSKNGIFYLVENLANRIKPERHYLFLTAGWAHSASYLTGIIGGIIISFKIWKDRSKLENN
jgi:hypothetical protein